MGMRYPVPRLHVVCGAFSSRSNTCKWLAGLPRVCRKSLGRLRSAWRLPTLGACLRMHFPLPRVREVCDALSSRFNACKWLAGLPRVCRKSLGRFQSAWRLCLLWAPACACTSPYLGCAKFVALYVCDLKLANDSQACHEFAENVWADSIKCLEILPTLGACLLMRCPYLGCASLWPFKFAIKRLQITRRLGASLQRKFVGCFQSAWKLCPLWEPACACAAPYLRGIEWSNPFWKCSQNLAFARVARKN